MAESLVESGSIDTARSILEKSGGKIVLPVDGIAGKKGDTITKPKIVSVKSVPPGWSIFDIGPRSIENFSEALKSAKLVVWNGPLGMFEDARYSEGTFAIARLLASGGATTIIGGGDSASAVKKAGVAKQMTHVSTGGGASLEFLEGKILPGVAALADK
jgi:phosphoglycerate kinase